MVKYANEGGAGRAEPAILVYKNKIILILNGRAGKSETMQGTKHG